MQQTIEPNNENRPLRLGILLQSTKKLFNYLVRKWWIIALVGFTGGCIGFVMAYLEKPKYQSHLTFALEEGDNGLGGALSLAAEFGFTIGNSSNIFEGDNILSLLTSRRIVERVLLSVDTVDGKPMTMADYFAKVTADSTKKIDPEKLSAAQIRLSQVSFPVNQPRASFSYLQDSVLLNLYNNFAVDGLLKVGKPDRKLNLYEISVTTPNERFSKVFTDKLIKEATDFYVELKTKKSRETLQILEDRVAQTKGSLKSAINSSASLQDANTNPAFRQAEAKVQQQQVDITAYGGAYAELYKNLEIARYQFLKDKPLLQIIDPADYPMKKVKRGKLLTAVIMAVVFGFLVILFLIARYIVVTELEKEKGLIQQR